VLLDCGLRLSKIAGIEDRDVFLQAVRAIRLDHRLARSRAPKERSVLSHDFWLTELGVLAFARCPALLTITHWWNGRVLASRKQRGLLSLPTVPDAPRVVCNVASGKDFPCSVELDRPIVTDSERRAQSLRELTEQLGGADRFWFAPLPRLRALADSTQWINCGVSRINCGVSRAAAGSSGRVMSPVRVRRLADFSKGRIKVIPRKQQLLP
jgi:hypothetical protein